MNRRRDKFKVERKFTLGEHMRLMDDTLKEIQKDVKELIRRGERITALEVKTDVQEEQISTLRADLTTAEEKIDSVDKKTTKVLWIIGAAYSAIIFLVTLFAEELKHLLFKQ